MSFKTVSEKGAIMKTRLTQALVLTLIAGIALFGCPIQTGLTANPISVPDDIMSPIGMDPASGFGMAESSSTNYFVLPILFVPSDLTPNPYGLRHIDQHMQIIQRWYAEQLREELSHFSQPSWYKAATPLAFTTKIAIRLTRIVIGDIKCGIPYSRTCLH
jgi:hypothetical protein